MAENAGAGSGERTGFGGGAEQMSRDQGAVNRNGTEKSYIRHAKGRKKREHNFARYDATTREIIFEVIEAVIEEIQGNFGDRGGVSSRLELTIEGLHDLDRRQDRIANDLAILRAQVRLLQLLAWTCWHR